LGCLRLNILEQNYKLSALQINSGLEALTQEKTTKTLRRSLPYGETFFERRSYWNTPYKFNAKELDEETGMYYYGARYYTPEASIWLSVDRFADKYPHLSPYHYCAGNPINLIDINGDSIIDGKGNVVNITINEVEGKHSVSYQFAEGTSDEVKESFMENAGSLFETMVDTETGRESIIEANNSENLIHYSISDDIFVTDAGEVVGGQTKDIMNPKTGKLYSQITVYKGSAQYWVNNNKFNQNKLTLEQKMATNAGHETYHATNSVDLYVRRVLQRQLTNKEHRGAYEVGNKMSFEFGLLNRAYD
jgi:RHS repeat-associated protein